VQEATARVVPLFNMTAQNLRGESNEIDTSACFAFDCHVATAPHGRRNDVSGWVTNVQTRRVNVGVKKEKRDIIVF
jgi:hypothetical protein